MFYTPGNFNFQTELPVTYADSIYAQIGFNGYMSGFFVTTNRGFEGLAPPVLESTEFDETYVPFERLD